MNPLRHGYIKFLIFILLPVVLVGVAISWDLQRLDSDFNRLYLLLRNARWDAFYKNSTIVVKFNGDTVTVTNQQEVSQTISVRIPMISRVDYDTVMGNNMIVYTPRGTSAHNRRVHGGEIMLKSLLGFRKYIHVNCNGMVTEGRYPEDV